MEPVMEKLLELAVQQGIWAVLYLYLFFRMLRENAKREEKYQGMIAELNGKVVQGIEKISVKLDALVAHEG